MRSWLRAVGYAQLAMRSWLCAVKAEREASLWRGELCPAGTGAFSLFIIGAACAAASLLAELWPPSRRAADGGLLGAAAPPRPPLHSPRTTPLGFPYPTNLLGCHQLPPKDDSIGFPTTASLRGLHGLCFGSFPPFGRVISLRAAQCHHELELRSDSRPHAVNYAGDTRIRWESYHMLSIALEVRELEGRAATCRQLRRRYVN